MADQYLAFAWAETQFQGDTYALPFDTDARALFYNKDLIEAAGQDPARSISPTGRPRSPTSMPSPTRSPSTTPTATTRMGWIPGGPGPAGNPGAIDQGWHYTWGFAIGGNFADLEACQVTPTDPGVVAGYQFLYDWAAAHDPARSPASWQRTCPTRPTRPQQNAFVTGKLGMVITGDWRITQMAQLAPDMNYGFTYIPVPNEGDESATWAGGWSAALIPDSDASPTRRGKFMQYLAGPEGQAMYTMETAHLPTLNALLEDPSLSMSSTRNSSTCSTAQQPPAAGGRRPLLGCPDRGAGRGRAEHAEPEAALQEVADAVQPQLDAVGC